MSENQQDSAALAAKPPPTAQPPGLLKSFVAGGAGGSCLVLVGHPLDTVKVRIQTMPVPKAGEVPMYSGAFDCIMKTIRNEGPFALYKGMGAPLAGVTPMYALCFFGYGIGQKIFCNENSFRDLDLVRIGLAGAVSGAFTTPILAPGERAKCVLQVQNTIPGGRKFAGPREVWAHLYQEAGGGVRGLASINRGFMATLGRDSAGSLLYFSSYEYLKKKLTPDGAKSPSVAGTLFAGGMAGVLNWIPALPFDTLKSRLQIAPEGKYPHGIRSVFADVMRNEGPTALYKGFSAVMLRAFPANAACFLGYETAIKLMNAIPLLDGL